MPCRSYIVYCADPNPDHGWDEWTSTYSSHQEALQRVERLLDPRYAPAPARIALYQLVEVVREEPEVPPKPKPEG
jgi:hypothetical protein